MNICFVVVVVDVLLVSRHWWCLFCCCYDDVTIKYCSYLTLVRELWCVCFLLVIKHSLNKLWPEYVARWADILSIFVRRRCCCISCYRCRICRRFATDQRFSCCIISRFCHWLLVWCCHNLTQNRIYTDSSRWAYRFSLLACCLLSQSHRKCAASTATAFTISSQRVACVRWQMEARCATTVVVIALATCRHFITVAIRAQFTGTLGDRKSVV